MVDWNPADDGKADADQDIPKAAVDDEDDDVPFNCCELIWVVTLHTDCINKGGNKDEEEDEDKIEEPNVVEDILKVPNLTAAEACCV